MEMITTTTNAPSLPRTKTKEQLANILESKYEIWISPHFCFIITRWCNKKCNHCLWNCGPEKIEKLDKNQTKYIIEELASKWVKSISISGGEPFLHLDNLAFVTYHLWKNQIKLKHIKTNMIHADHPYYKDKVQHIFIQYMIGLKEAGIKNPEYYLSQWIEPSIDEFHGNTVEELSKLKKIIDINMNIIKDSNFSNNRFMNVSIMRNLEKSKDLQNIFQIIYFLQQKEYEVKFINKIYNRESKKLEESQITDNKEIINSLHKQIHNDYIKLEISKWWKTICIRLGLNDIYKIWRATKLESNIQEKTLGKTDEYLKRYHQNFSISGIDNDGNLYTDEISTHTGNFPIGNIWDGMENTIEENSYNPILIELTNHGLSRVIEWLLEIYPDLAEFQYVVYDDILQKIFSLPDGEEILYELCFNEIIEDYDR